MMMMKSVFWWRKPEYPEETSDLRQVTDESLCPVRGLNLGRSGVKQSELRRDESDALAHRATEVPTFLDEVQRVQLLVLSKYRFGVYNLFGDGRNDSTPDNFDTALLYPPCWVGSILGFKVVLLMESTKCLYLVVVPDY